MNCYVTFVIVCLLLPLVVHANIFDSLEHQLRNIERHAKHEFKDVIRSKPVSDFKSAVRNMAIGSASLGHSRHRNQQKPTVNGFQWKSCGPADQLVDIRDLKITPDPLSFPGQLTFGFDIVFHDTISASAQVSADLKLQFRKSSSEQWIVIPCVGQIGSCTYSDVCTLSKAIQCPPDLTEKGIPCTCPFNKGEYKLPSYTVEVDASVFLAGEYQGHVVMTDSSKGQIACYQVNFSVE